MILIYFAKFYYFGTITALRYNMKSELIAIPVFEERISPLLDVSERFVLYEVKDKRVTQRIVINVNAETDRMRIQKLYELGVSVIISGAVSRYLSGIITGTGMRHISWISGPVDEVIVSFLNDTLEPVPPKGGSCGGMMRRGRLIADVLPSARSAETDKKETL
jgi:predicted Fe-Mo cluster-binding NifX family protein